ncbi:OLC1v1017345C1 [Oldenlandia corymbosa var. corymbosa]|uniref:OLC1v1017345C1 n=1 Tax=Oldenlandia corymbosa var. corymbosa TaxID=529605 RepID=A0AAV1E989_OLDCO|nr:OLC1v1017345C1 [Oldenlandia corymbosa var. corymbosa]
MADVDAAKPPTLSEQYFLKGKDKPVEDVKTPVATTVEETVVETVKAVEESPAVESSDPVESSETNEAASVESAEAAPVAASSEATPAAESSDTAPAESTEDAPASEAASGDDSPATEEASEEAEAAEDDAPKIKLETAPADFRFPTTNQTRHCFTRYVEYHRCIAAKGDDAPECQKFAKYYRALCPGEWVDRWNEQRENGTFPGPL